MRTRYDLGRLTIPSSRQTVNNNQILAALAALVANGGAAQKAVDKAIKGAKGKKGGREKLTEAEKAAFIAKNDAECVAIFTKAGYKDIQPRVNVMTYKKFIESGRKVRKGEKSTRVGPFNLFHVDQTEALTTEQVVAPTPQPNAEAPQTVQ